MTNQVAQKKIRSKNKEHVVWREERIVLLAASGMRNKPDCSALGASKWIMIIMMQLW